MSEPVEYMTLRPDALLHVPMKIEMPADIDYLDDDDDDDGGGFQYSQQQVPIYLEVDRGTEKLEQIRRQVNYYIAAYLSDQWFDQKSEFPLVCWIFEKTSMAERLRALMQAIMKEPREVVVRTKRGGRYEVESDFNLAYFNTCITTKEAFYGAESITSDRIWYTNRSPERRSLNAIAGIRFDAQRKLEEEKRQRELYLKRLRETVEA